MTWITWGKENFMKNKWGLARTCYKYIRMYGKYNNSFSIKVVFASGVSGYFLFVHFSYTVNVYIATAVWEISSDYIWQKLGLKMKLSNGRI